MGHCICYNCQKQKPEILNRQKEKEIEEEKTVVFVGPKWSGKSSLIYFLKNSRKKQQFKESKTIEQTIINFNNKAYDIKEFQNYTEQIKTDAWIYVEDVYKTQDCTEMIDFLTKIDKNIPVLFYLNKTDLQNEDRAFDKSQFSQIKDKKYQFFYSNYEGEGVAEGFQWLHDQLYPKRGNYNKIL